MWDLQAAVNEVQQKSDAQIETETAYAWGSRAAACWVLFKQTGDASWMRRAECFESEAVEHAALVRDGGHTLALIEAGLVEMKK